MRAGICSTDACQCDNVSQGFSAIRSSLARKALVSKSRLGPPSQAQRDRDQHHVAEQPGPSDNVQSHPRMHNVDVMLPFGLVLFKIQLRTGPHLEFGHDHGQWTPVSNPSSGKTQQSNVCPRSEPKKGACPPIPENVSHNNPPRFGTTWLQGK